MCTGIGIWFVLVRRWRSTGVEGAKLSFGILGLWRSAFLGAIRLTAVNLQSVCPPSPGGRMTFLFGQKSHQKRPPRHLSPSGSLAPADFRGPHRHAVRGVTIACVSVLLTYPLK